VSCVGRIRSWWGWGWVDQALDDAECIRLGAMLPGAVEEPVSAPEIDWLELPEPRIAPPAPLAARCTTAPHARAAHTYGKAYRDVVRGLRGELHHPPDVVAYPHTEADMVRILDWAGPANVAVVPYGGGSSVVGGVEYRGGDHVGVVCLDLTRMDRVLEVDRHSRAARIQAGALGPVLEEQLHPHGLSLRHFPQSFEFSTLGGWLATRSAGHYATLHTHIDDFVESLRVVTPAGVSQSWRLPASGAGPSPDRMFLGSEGALGVITEAWVRVQERPLHRAGASVRFDEFTDAVAALRAIAQSGLHPTNCRLLDASEALFSGAGDGGHNVLIIGFESAAVPVDAALAQAVEIAQAHRGDVTPPREADPASSWRASFLRMPYVRDGLARMSAIVETFETACTWDAVPELCHAVRAEVADTVAQTCGTPGLVTCRFTHVYADGAAPYFTVLAAGRRGAEIAMWDEIKAAASEILQRFGATITHHHGIGRDHRPWYDRQRPDPFAAALVAAKRALDPYGVLNPGVLIDPLPT
jgi:alkyldihydroxyacetonephosphate synthase